MTRKPLLTLIAFGAFALAPVLACSSEEEEQPYASVSSFCDAKATTECTSLAAACGTTIEVCKPKRVDACNGAAGGATGTGRAYRPNAAQPCLEKLAEVYAGKGIGLTAAQEAAATKVCERVFGGSKALNERCGTTAECSGALICDTQCAAELVKNKGEGCGNAGDVCAKGTYCQTADAGKRFCVDRNKLADICAADAPCSEDLRCVSRCLAKVAGGQPCDKDADCADEAPFCDLTTMPRKCRPKYQAGTAVCKDFGSTI